MSMRASWGSSNALTTAPGTACRIFSGHDASTSGGNSTILKLMAWLLCESVRSSTGRREAARSRSAETPRRRIPVCAAGRPTSSGGLKQRQALVGVIAPAFHPVDDLWLASQRLHGTRQTEPVEHLLLP